MSQYFPLSCPNAHGAGIGTLSWTKIASTGMPGFTGPFPSTSLDKAPVIQLLMSAGVRLTRHLPASQSRDMLTQPRKLVKRYG